MDSVEKFYIIHNDLDFNVGLLPESWNTWNNPPSEGFSESQREFVKLWRHNRGNIYYSLYEDGTHKATLVGHLHKGSIYCLGQVNNDCIVTGQNQVVSNITQNFSPNNTIVNINNVNGSASILDSIYALERDQRLYNTRMVAMDKTFREAYYAITSEELESRRISKVNADLLRKFKSQFLVLREMENKEPLLKKGLHLSEGSYVDMKYNMEHVWTLTSKSKK